MSINFYVRLPNFTIKHVGKSAAGWNFMLHVYPEEGINDLQDWEPIFTNPEVVILNEYGDIISPQLLRS